MYYSRTLYSIYVKRKARIRTILGFCCANLGSDLWRNTPRIAHANIGRIRGFAAQTSNPHAIIQDRATKPRPSAATNPQSITQTEQLGHPQKRSHNRSQPQSSSTFCGKEATNDHTRKAARPSVATKHN